MINGRSKYEENYLSSNGWKIQDENGYGVCGRRRKRLVGGRSCSLQLQALPKYKTETP
jgi:hypothetical protein